MAASMPCKRKAQISTTKVAAKQGIASQKIPKTIYGCIVEFHESTVESSLLTKQNDQVAGEYHYNLVHKFIPMPQAIKSSSESSGGQRMGKIGENFGVGPDKSQKKERGDG